MLGAVSGNRMLPVTVGPLGHHNAEIVAASGGSGYVLGHGGGHVSKWRGRVNGGTGMWRLQLNLRPNHAFFARQISYSFHRKLNFLDLRVRDN